MSPLSIIQKNRYRGFILFFSLLFSIQSQVLAQPSPRPEDAFLLKEGEILLSKGETEKALWRFKRLTAEFPNSPLFLEAKFRMGICLTRLERPKDAIRVLNDLLSTFLSPPRMVEVFTLLGDNHLELKDPHNALKWYGKGLLVPKQPQEELKKKVRGVIDAFDNERGLQQMEALYRGAYAGSYAKFRLAQLAKRRGDDPLAKKILAELEKEYGHMDFSAPMKEVPGAVQPLSPPAKYRIGVILPLSGIHRSFGERALQSIQFAFKEGPEHRETGLISLIVRDSQGSPAEAERTVEELVTKERVIAIIGPLLSSTAETAAKKAQQLKVPLITFSPKDLLTGRGEFVFQNSLTPSSQIQALAEFSMRQLGHRTFAVFYPNSPYGLHFKNLFSREAGRKGGKVQGAVAYLENQTDFGQEIKGFFKIQPKPQFDSRRKNEEESKIGLSVDGLFIPDTYDRVALILSQMAYYGVNGVTFLGNNGWNHPGLISVAGNSAEGALFVDAFCKENPLPSVNRFVEEFKRSYRRAPDTLEALAYEGAELLREVLHSKSPSSPLQLKEEIYRTKTFQGVAGLRGFGEDGKMIRTLSILKVNHSRIELVSP